MLSILFAGTPKIAVPSLETLAELATSPAAGISVAAVLTNPDAPAGRGRRSTASPVKQRSIALGIPVIQPPRLDAEARRQVAAYAPDLLVVVAYGRIFGPKFLALFPHGGINMHPSLLPLHRGPSPIQAALLAGDAETGITIQYLAREMDSGDIIAQEKMPIPADANAGRMHEVLATSGASLLGRTVETIVRGTVEARPQNHAAATYSTKISKEDGWIDWNRSAEEIARAIRAYTPWPAARCRWGETTLQIVKASAAEGRSDAVAGTVLAIDNALGILIQTGDGVLAAARIKPQARSEMDHRSFYNGNPSIIGSVLE